MQCVIGCVCGGGLLRNAQGICVPPSQCGPRTNPPSRPTECGVGEEFTTCGSSCEKTCASKDLNILCPAVCQTGCFCRRGLVRNEQGVCVSPDQCSASIRAVEPIVCGRNEGYSECGTACPATCANLNSGATACIAVCVSGCFCQTGFVRNEQNVCVPPTQCSSTNPVRPIRPIQPQPQVCGRNEEYSECGTACPRTCANLNNGPTACIAVCVSGCFCQGDWVRNEQKVCVPPTQCSATNPVRPIQPIQPQVCGRNEEYKTCGTSCPKTCANMYSGPIACDKMCNRGCFCQNGFVRNNQNVCVPTTQCSTITTYPIRPIQPQPQACGRNEEYTTCGTSCPETCANMNSGPKMCNLMCNTGCFCRRGFVRNDQRLCVSPNECPINSVRPTGSMDSLQADARDDSSPTWTTSVVGCPVRT